MISRPRSLLSIALIVVATTITLAQKSAPPPTSTPRTTTTPTPPTVQNPPLTSPSDLVLFINGKVSMDDGTELPSNIVVDRVCNGNTRQQVHADTRGNFTFELGSRFSEVMTDVSVSQQSGAGSGMPNSGFGGSTSTQMGVSRQSLWSCEIRAEASGFRSASSNLSSYSPGQTIDVGTIFLQRGEKVQGTTISVTSYQAPKDAKKAYEKGIEAAKKGNFADAQKLFEKAVQVYSQYATAWYQLGSLLDRQKQTEPARKAYEQAIAADPRYVPPFISLAVLAAQSGNWKDVLNMSQRGIDLDPLNYPAAYYLNSLANYRLNNLAAAEKGARSAERYDQQHRFPQVHLLLASILSDSKSYSEAITEYSAFLRLAPDSKDADAIRARVSTLEKLASATASNQ